VTCRGDPNLLQEMRGNLVGLNCAYARVTFITGPEVGAWKQVGRTDLLARVFV